MNKLNIIILVMLLIIPAAYALEECDSPVEPNEVPCLVISTYQFSDSCNSFNAKIYNSSPSLLSTKTYGEYGSTGRCNITFNYSKRGSYILNSSDGSSASIIVGGEKMLIVNMLLFLVFFGIGLFLIKLMHQYQEDNASVAYGFFAMALFGIMGAMGLFGFEFIDIENIVLPFNPNNLIGLISLLLGIYAAWLSTSLVNFRRRQARQAIEKEDIRMGRY
jgi:hypothetical protein